MTRQIAREAGEALEHAATAMLDELLRVEKALRPLRAGAAVLGGAGRLPG